jgi:crossover junction endodeoxyribonuclease RusA
LNSFIFTVPGHPIPCVRTTQKQKWVSESYKKYQGYKSRVNASLQKKMIEDLKKFIKIDSELAVDCKFYVAGNRMGDIDNLVKGIFDGIQDNKRFDGIIKNDKQVKELSAKIIPCEKEEERVEITLQWEEKTEPCKTSAKRPLGTKRNKKVRKV